MKSLFKLLIICIYTLIFFNAVVTTGAIPPTVNVTGTPLLENLTSTSPQTKNVSNLQSILLKNVNAVVTLVCRADYPILWIFDYDRIDRRYISGVTQWVERKFDNFWNTSTYHFEVYFQIKFKIVRLLERMTCQKVGEEEIYTTITILPIDDKLKVDVSSSGIETSPKFSEFQQCELRFTVKSRPEGPVWKCETEDGAAGELDFEGCLFGMPCANLYREIRKQKTCVKILKPDEVCLPASRCWQNDNAAHALRPTLVHCLHNGVRRALSYFFSFPNGGLPTSHKLHLSWNEVTGDEMLFLDPLPRSVFYVGEKVNVTCRISRYFFSYGYRFGVEVNQTLELLAPDDYSSLDGITNARVATQSIYLNDTRINAILCFAPIFNSTEWTNKSVPLRIKHPTQPRFTKSIEEISFDSGSKEQSISCNAIGEPEPEILWHKENFVNSTRLGLNWTFLEIKPGIEGTYVCEATNSVGGYAKKIFRVTVADSSTSLTIIINTTIVVVALLLLIGLLLACWKVKKVKKQLRQLSKEDIKNFREGTQNDSDVNLEDGNAKIESLPYNQAFEISRENLEIDKNVLGSGNFGIVRKGVIKTPSGPVSVAVKGIKPGADLMYLKALLAELKIMAYLENGHENIVHLVGACTTNVEKGDVHVGLELCKSSLVCLLRNKDYNFLHYVRKGKLVSEIDDSEMSDYKNVANGLSTFDLIQWSFQIANGMNYLSSKRVIHGDLAARNILISHELKAKIADFGLARQLIDYNYIKSEHCPLPWKWMAIESLSEMKFSTASDVWAFGITLWEIFSLGQTPYPGLSWTVDFVDQLVQGLRPSIPPYATEFIYKLMLACWDPKPNGRPTFNQLMDTLSMMKADTENRSYQNFK